MPIVFGVLPILGATFLANEMTENLLLLMAALIGAASLSAGYLMHHRRILPIALFGIGLSLILIGRVGVDEGSPYELLLSVTGVLLFAVAHFVNYRFCKACCE